MCYVFAGEYRGGHGHESGHGTHHHDPHESPAVMTGPLVVLAVLAVVLGFFGTPSVAVVRQLSIGLQSARLGL